MSCGVSNAAEIEELRFIKDLHIRFVFSASSFRNYNAFTILICTLFLVQDA